MAERDAGRRYGRGRAGVELVPVDQETFDLLKGFWVQEGGDPGAADLAASIAFAESAGCQYALAGPRDIRPVKECTWHVTNGENSCGYWQINLRAHPDYSAPSIFNPATNARAAIAISDNGRDFRPWSTYNDGAYRPFLAQFAGDAPTGQPPPSASSSSSSDSTVAAGAWSDGWQRLSHELGRTLPSALARSHHLGQQTLRVMAHNRKVVR